MWLNVSSGSSGGRVSSSTDNTLNDINEEILTSSSYGHQDRVDVNKGSPLMRYKHAICSSQAGHIYLHGGRYGNKPLDDDLWRFDPHENTWHQLDTCGIKPPSLQEHTLVEFEDSLYLFGGQVSTSDSDNSFWRLDLDRHEWQLLNQRSSRRGAHLEPTNRRGHSAVVRNNCMYIFGGFEDFRGSSGQLWEFNFRTQLWQLIDLNASSSSKPEPRHGHSAIVYGDSMYIYGGLSNLKPLSDLWRWSWNEKRWSREKTKGRSPGHLHGHTAIQAFGSMFIFGGERKGMTTRALWRLNLSNLCWHKIRAREPQPCPTTWHGAVVNPINRLEETNYIVESANQSSVGLSSENFNQDSCRAKNSQSLCSNQQPLNSISAGNLKGLQEPQSSLGRKKRGSRLTFLKRLRRRRNSESGHTRSKSMTEPLPSGLLSSNVEASTSACQLPATTCANQPDHPKLAESNFVSMDEPIEEEYDKANTSEHPAATSILDNLNEDIKQMFEEHSIEPEDQLSEIQDEPISKLCAKNQSNDLQSTSNTSHYVTVRQQSTSGTLNLTSQRTSCSYATPMSEISMASNAAGPSRVLPNSSRHAERHARALAAVKNKSVRRDDRPKSEIVQSLIERADSSIKHMYTPFFKRTDPKRLSLGDSSKRHTLPQTMTYYNLYFEEELSEQLSLVPSEHHLSSSTIKASTTTTTTTTSTNHHLGNGALVGIHQDSTVTNNNSSKLNSSNGKTPGAASSTESKTLCNQDITPEASGSTIGNVESIPSALTMRRDTADEANGDNTSLSFSAIAEFEEDDMLQYAIPDPEEKSQQETAAKFKLEMSVPNECKSERNQRYWQLCMFVIGGKQTGALGMHEPINVWRLYI